MAELKLSVVIPTRDRPEKLRATLAALARQHDLDHRDFEVIVADDGSNPPAATEIPPDGRVATVVRLGGEGPSAARNRGAEAARGDLLVFVDDDMRLAPDFLLSHWRVHRERPDVLQVGQIRLPQALVETPFGRFRQALEDEVVPRLGGPVESPNFCTAANMAIERSAFEELGGFNTELRTGEDQDLALRHTSSGGQIVFVPAASAVHDDDALGIDSYTRRAERGMEELAGFAERHPDWPDSVERARVNGPTRWGREPPSLSAKKALKRVMLWPPVRGITIGLVHVLERLAPRSALLDRLYRALLGAHLQRGYRQGLRRDGG